MSQKRTIKKRRPSKKELLAKIRIHPDPILKQVCEPFSEAGRVQAIRLLTSVLCATDNGVGLAAPQVGLLKRVIALRPHKMAVQIMFNPNIQDIGRDNNLAPVTEKAVEGCLSYPGVNKEIERYDSIQVCYECVDGREQIKWFHGFTARIIQHEIDHLKGKCKVGTK